MCILTTAIYIYIYRVSSGFANVIEVVLLLLLFRKIADQLKKNGVMLFSCASKRLRSQPTNIMVVD